MATLLHTGAQGTHTWHFTTHTYPMSKHIFAPPTADGGVYSQKSSFQLLKCLFSTNAMGTLVGPRFAEVLYTMSFM